MSKNETSLLGGATSPLPDGWRSVRLRDVAEINPPRPAGFERDPDAPTTFVPMSVVDAVRGVIAEAETKPFADVAKGYTFFLEGDVLFAKITPCMQNGKHAVARNLLDGVGFASTEFHVIRAGDDVLPEWIHGFVRQPTVLLEATNHFTGAVGQQRVPDGFLKDLVMPLPPIPEQERIVAKLREQMAAVERARRAAQEQLATASKLASASLRQECEQGQWPIRRLGDGITGIEAGTSVQSLERPKANGEGGVLKVSAVSWGRFKPQENKAVPPDYTPSQREIVQDGDFLISRCNTAELAGAVVIVREPPTYLMLSDKTLRLLIKRDVYVPDFLEFALRTRIARKFIECNATGTSYSMRNISQETIRAIQVPTPPIGEQRRVAARLGRIAAIVETAKTNIVDQADAIAGLPAALLREAFSGGL